MHRLLPLLLVLIIASPAEAWPTQKDLKHYGKVAYKWATKVFVPIMLVSANVLIALKR